MNPTTLRQWLQRGEIEKLETVVLEGRGARLLGEHSPDLRTRVFLKILPNYLTKISQAHDAVSRGALPEIRRIVSEEPKKKLALAKDSSGTPLLHKAVYHDHQDIVEWLIQNYPATAQQKDKDGRTALHYVAACRDPGAVWDVLVDGGCDVSVCDNRGFPPSHYLQRGAEIELVDAQKMTHRKLSIIGKENLDFKPSNIRIWIHNRDIKKLQRVVWEGHGTKLRCETSNNPRVKKFLEAVPFIMGTIKDMHAATVKNDLQSFRRKIAEPVSAMILYSKDRNSLNVLHKAAGLGHIEIAREILERFPGMVNTEDSEKKTPLHYAASLKDGGTMYNLLVEYGADEDKVDNKQKTASFYKNRPSDIDARTLVVVPYAPRVSGSTYPKNWDWRILETGENLTKGAKKGASSVDVDSAFGNVEATSKIANGTKQMFEDDDKEEDTTDDLMEQIRKADAELEREKREYYEAQAIALKNDEFRWKTDKKPEEEHRKEPEAEPDKETEEKSGSDDEEVVTGTNFTRAEETSEAFDRRNDEERTNENNNNNNNNIAKNEIQVTGYSPMETSMGEQTSSEERTDPSTGDSGVDDPGHPDEEVFAGEHEELPETELNEGSMTLDPEVDNLLENGNMEQLATLVLNGDGRRLVGRHSSNPELQAFIDNVPAYMGKIHAVHMAAREGNLRDLQSVLDRRKFAIARDGSSPHGSTPLHVAVIFGHTAVIRYLAGRFPETAHATDTDGRTPLHYAATLADNGHYYNLLLHLGANPLIQDNFGHKADYYKQNQEDLSHKKLLRDFGARERLADEMLTDKDDPQVDIPIFRTEEGRYLASSLGDPLIKGLTEVANSRPKDPVSYLATYLYNFARENKSGDKTQQSNVLIIPEREQGQLEEPGENENGDDDAGYPQSPDSESQDTPMSNANRDEHGQSMLHFAAVRTHAKDALFQLLQETELNVGYRDELYRTARDVAQQAGVRENVQEIDRWVVYLAARGETEKLVELLMEGYEHILDAEDDGVNITEVATQRNHEGTVEFLQSIPKFVSRREEIHRAIRGGDIRTVMELFNHNHSNGGGTLLALGKNNLGRCALHIAVLSEHSDIVRYIAKTYPETLRVGDNLERTALHYAMGVESVEKLSSILIKSGAKRVVKDLKARQPTYYFMNKTEIARLQEEEESL